MSEANWYGTVFKTWQSKLLGPKPTAEMLANVHNLGARPGKQALACAMALRADGVTASQIQIACGAPQRNKMRGFEADALLKREPASPSPQGHTVYKLALTKKGEARIERTLKQAAKLEAEAVNTGQADKPAKAPSKAKGAAKRKARKAEAPADVATGEPEAATNEPNVTGQADTAQMGAV